MKIYVVTSGEYSDYGIDAVFVDEEKARKYCAERNSESDWCDCDIETYDTDDVKVDDSIDYEYRHIFRYRLNELLYECGEYVRWGGKSYVEKEINCIKIVVILHDRNETQALKIASDMLAKYKAQQEGI